MRYSRMLLSVWAIVVIAVASACNLTAGPPTGGNTGSGTPPDSGRPVVVINSPANGAEFTVGQQILVSATATDSVGISRVQLIANGTVVKTLNSESPTGDRTLNALLDYTPQTAGELRLQVVAYRAATASNPAAITVNVRQTQQQVTATSGPPPLITQPPIINPNDPTCRVLTNANVNLRQGPDTTYPVVTLLNAGSVLPVTGRIGSNQWYQVRLNTTLGWVSAGFVTLYGSLCSSVPIVPVPPTATPQGQVPTATRSNTPVPPTITPSAIPPTITPGLADLLITGVSGPTTLVLGPGSTPVTASFNVTITNTSGRGTGQFANTITVLPGGTAQALGTVANLNPGESILLTISLTFSSAGTYTVQAQADSGSVVTEASEVNNIGFGSVTVNNP